MRGEKLAKADRVRWHRILAERGWPGHSWKREYGGTGWGPVERFIWDEETQLAGAPKANIPARGSRYAVAL